MVISPPWPPAQAQHCWDRLRHPAVLSPPLDRHLEEDRHRPPLRHPLLWRLPQDRPDHGTLLGFGPSALVLTGAKESHTSSDSHLAVGVGAAHRVYRCRRRRPRPLLVLALAIIILVVVRLHSTGTTE